MRRSPLLAAGSALAALLVGAPGAEALALGVNPVRKVVNLLQQMQSKVTAEGEKEKELYEKFECWCTTGAKNLTETRGGSALARVPRHPVSAPVRPESFFSWASWQVTAELAPWIVIGTLWVTREGG